MGRLKDSRVIVTGASSGIGEEAARRFAKAGAKVAIVSEQDKELHQVAESIVAAGGSARAFVADFSKPEQVAGLFARIESDLGPIDTLVNNAGVGLGASVLETKPSDLRFLFEVNFFALVTLCQEALSAMQARRRGHIINVSSAAARFGSPNVSAYSATKGAAHTFTQALRTEASVLGVQVSEILPISVRTKFFENVKGEKYRPSGVVLTTEQVAESIVRCAASDRPPAEVLPYFWVKAAFVADALFPDLMARLAARRYVQGRERSES